MLAVGGTSLIWLSHDEPAAEPQPRREGVSGGSGD